MKDIYKNYLFAKRILVSEKNSSPEEAFSVVFSLASLFNIKIVSGGELAEPGIIKTAEVNIGKKVPDPFYKGFPESVRALSPDQLLFDQLVHYTVTYGFGIFGEAGHSILEPALEKTAFKEDSDIREFSIFTEERAVEEIAWFVESLLSSSRPLSDEQYGLVLGFITDYDYQIKDCASKNTAIKLLIDTRNIKYAVYLMLSDVIKLTDELNYTVYGNEDIRQLNLKNTDRKFITAVIDRLITAGRCDTAACYEKKALWSGLLHHIHYKPINDMAARFVADMRSDRNGSVYSVFENAMGTGEVRVALDVLKKGKGSGAVLRNLDYLLSRAESWEDTAYILNNIDSRNLIVLIQLLMKYSSLPEAGERRFFRFTRHNLMEIHHESEEEQRKRRTEMTPLQAQLLVSKLQENIRSLLAGRLGKVYIDEGMKNMALPLQENTSSGGFGVMAKGSRIHLEEGKKIRAFTYWEGVDDIDLSVIGIGSGGRQEVFSWQTMWDNQSEAITFSGDETSGSKGGSEFFDIDTALFKELAPELKYLVFCNNVYTQTFFSDCLCKAGYMTRDIIDSGEIFEPKTVKSSFVIDCRSTFAYLFGIDLENNDFVWLNMARDSSARVASSSSASFLRQYFNAVSVINLYSFFEMMASVTVDDPLIADVVVSDKALEVREGTEVIHSYDFDKLLALMNK
ncbi:MAG: hypothetical protein IKT01_06700 [Eubacteriaceae bacterium]|nr:hypothetical protein [Eubacteriaceae bacterium]